MARTEDEIDGVEDGAEGAGIAAMGACEAGTEEVDIDGVEDGVDGAGVAATGTVDDFVFLGFFMRFGLLCVLGSGSASPATRKEASRVAVLVDSTEVGLSARSCRTSGAFRSRVSKITLV